MVLLKSMTATHAQQLENDIYEVLDVFLVKKSKTTLILLTNEEIRFEQLVSTKEEKLALTILQCNKAFYLKDINQFQKAIQTYEKAWRRYEKAKLTRYDIVEYCLKPLGNLYTKVKDYTNAENIIKYYIFLAEKENNTSQKIAGVINLSKVYQCIQKHTMVLKMIDEVLHTYSINTTQKEMLLSIKNNSVLALSIWQEDDSLLINKTDNIYATYQGNLKKGDFKKALENFKTIKKSNLTTIVNLRDKAKIYIEEAQLFMLLKDEEKAKESISVSLGCLIPNYNKNKKIKQKQLYRESLFTAVFDLKAILEKEVEASLESYNNSFYVSDLLEEKITAQETRMILQSEKRIRSEKCIALLLEEYTITQEEGLLEKAFLYADKGKSFLLEDKLLKKELLKMYPKDSLLLLEKELLKKQQVLTNELIKGGTKTEISNLNKELNAYSVQIKNTQAIVKKKYHKNNGSKKNTVAQIQEKVKKQKAVFVEYFFGKKNIYQFIVHENKTEIYTIKVTKDVEQRIINYIRLFNSPSEINNDIKAFTSQAYEIYDLLKLNKVYKYKKILLVTDGVLNFIPFETLLTKRTNEMLYSEMPFLVKRHSITYNFNTRFFLKEEQKKQKDKVLGFFPVFSNTGKELKYSLNEAKVLERDFESIIFKNKEATKKNFINNINNATIIHLSTHSKSGNYIGEANIEFHDEVLSLNELYTLDCNAGLVVLSACETGVGSLIKGEGAISIARGFNYIGAENLLFSLWEINDKSTSLIMNEFYNAYTKEIAFSNANQQAKIKYLANSEIENYNKSPYYWGAFVYYGALNNPVKSNKIVYIIIGGFLIFLIFLHFIKKSSNN